MAKRGPKNPMTPEHKAALAKGRVEGRVVREYLEALRANKPSPGRKRTAESVSKRLAAIERELAGADPVKELRLIQERLDLQAELQAFSVVVDISALESEFVKIATSYSDRNGVSYAAWRTVGVPAAVLKSAGISR
ncbi:MAG: hypothetical protein HY828_01725 [Actinobacteria bacterium]|nr:hypothetical protein [Actinomycetota bacterium]